jgi:hypothetical protein
MHARKLMLVGLMLLCSLAGCLSLVAPVALAATPPAIEEESVMEAAATSVTLQAQINPEGSETTYRFEYGTSEAYGSSIPLPDALVGSDSAGVTVSVHIQGLGASTGYHYRVVASVPSRGETVDGADGTFTTQPAGGEFMLPDGRLWELVSPPNKHGGAIRGLVQGVVQAAEDGSAITYLTNAPTELQPQGFSEEVQVLSRRGAQGWTSKDIATPHSAQAGISVGPGLEYRTFSSDLSSAVVEPFGPFTKLTPEGSERTPSIRHNFTCEAEPAACYTPLVTPADVPPGTEFDPSPKYFVDAVNFVDATPDLSHVVLSTSHHVALTSTPGDEGEGLYEWSAGRLQLVSIMPEAEGGAPVAALFGTEGQNGEIVRHALSNDGSRIIWAGRLGGSSDPLYMRDTQKGETVRIGTQEAPGYEDASRDGSRVFFKSTLSGGALYECDVTEVAGKLACPVTQLAPDIQGAVLGTSEDGSYVYFVSNSVLAPGAVSGTCSNLVIFQPPSVLCNLYMMHSNGATWEAPKLVAVLSAGDFGDWSGNGGDLQGLASSVSPSGHWLTFMSQRGLTGYDNRDAASGEPDEELYLYDTETGRLSCASCDPTGARPTGTEFKNVKESVLGGASGAPGTTWIAANIHAWTTYRLGVALYQSRYLSDSGRLFFDTPEALVPQDVNGTWDVYEFEPANVGGCAASSVTFNAQTGGCVGLISGGSSPEVSAFMEASANGDDVYFLSASHLSSEDFDTALDMYDAHVCSAAVPCHTPPVSPPPCTTGDGCKAAPSPQPTVFGAPPSATFSGVGNVSASPPPKSGVSSRSLNAKQKLARALKACRGKPRKRRGACERKARRQYRAKQARNAKSTRKGNR